MTQDADTPLRIEVLLEDFENELATYYSEPRHPKAEVIRLRNAITAAFRSRERPPADAVRDALEKCATQFERYAREHKEKADLAEPDSIARDNADAKADTNKRFADLARRALATDRSAR